MLNLSSVSSSNLIRKDKYKYISIGKLIQSGIKNCSCLQPKINNTGSTNKVNLGRDYQVGRPIRLWKYKLHV